MARGWGRFAAYGAVLGDAPARLFSATGFVARLPQSMTGIGIVLLVSLTSGSFGRAGAVAADVHGGGRGGRPGVGPGDGPGRPGTGAGRRYGRLRPRRQPDRGRRVRALAAAGHPGGHRAGRALLRPGGRLGAGPLDPPAARLAAAGHRVRPRGRGRRADLHRRTRPGDVPRDVGRPGRGAGGLGRGGGARRAGARRAARHRAAPAATADPGPTGLPAPHRPTGCRCTCWSRRCWRPRRAEGCSGAWRSWSWRSRASTASSRPPACC